MLMTSMCIDRGSDTVAAVESGRFRNLSDHFQTACVRCSHFGPLRASCLAEAIEAVLYYCEAATSLSIADNAAATTTSEKNGFAR